MKWFGLLLIMMISAQAAGLHGVYPPLARKAMQMERVCGAVVISGVRPGAHVYGTHRRSLHASGHAVDMRGNPGCMYGLLRGWPGGYSTDYRSVGHLHFSLGGSEDGRRFAHNRYTHWRYAQRHYRHYARR